MHQPFDRSDLEDLIRSACRGAKREFAVVGPTDHPTRWDDAHEYINELLDDWQLSD